MFLEREREPLGNLELLRSKLVEGIWHSWKRLEALLIFYFSSVFELCRQRTKVRIVGGFQLFGVLRHFCAYQPVILRLPQIIGLFLIIIKNIYIYETKNIYTNKKMLHLASITTNNKNKKCFNWILGTWFLLFSYKKKKKNKMKLMFFCVTKKKQTRHEFHFNICLLPGGLVDKYFLIVQATVNLDSQLKEYLNNIHIFIKNNVTLTFTFLYNFFTLISRFFLKKTKLPLNIRCIFIKF